ncbi:MAG: DUF2497 domain-containing protein [Pseudomonadota bacterium]
MATQQGNNAQALDADLNEQVQEPSMDEILASIKQIIAEDEAEPQVTRREDFEVPHAAVNSNAPAVETNPTEPMQGVSESDMAAAMEAEMFSELSAVAAVETEEQPSVAAVTGTPETLEDRAARVRAEVTAAGSGAGLSADERLAAYRVRGRLQTEALAHETARRAEKKAAQEAAFQQRKEETARQAFEAVSAGPVLPTTQAVAEQMAASMMAEKSSEIQAQLVDLMRPVIRQWLSDNLPSLVEKLVRDEIEAVSRGRKGG